MVVTKDESQYAERIAWGIAKKCPSWMIEDIIADGQLGLCKAKRDFDPTFRTSFKSYMYWRVMGECQDGLRRMNFGGRNGKGVVEELVDDVQDKKVLPDRVVLYGELIEMVAVLPPRQRTLITMRYFEGLKLREIAEEWGVSPSRVSQIHTKALLTLKRGLR